MTEFTHAVIDLDPCKYAVSSVSEKRTIKVVHRVSGDEYDCKTRTEWYGHYKKKAGGKLAEINKALSDDCKQLPEDFDIIDIVTPEPLSFALHTAKAFTDDILKASGCKTYSALIGSGDSWRVEASTLLKYKANRAQTQKPYHYDAVTNYLIQKYQAEVVTDLEVDDRLVIDTWGKPGTFSVAREKDIYSYAMHFFDYSSPGKGIQNGNQFGELYLNDKGEVKGIGRKHWMWQVCSSDTSDNYKANCFSDTDWGDKGAYNALLSASNDKELFQAGVDVFKMLYPEPKTVVGWRGDNILITWDYVMQEMMTMAWMLRHENDTVPLLKTLDKLGVKYA
jgi:hypothetical protein